MISFIKVTMKTKMIKCQKTIRDKESDGEVSDYFLVKILVLNASFRISQQEVLYENKCFEKTFSGVMFFCTYGQKP